MASPQSTDAFRFLDLPREIRDKIYRISLCSFEPRPTTVTVPLHSLEEDILIGGPEYAKHAVSTAILRVSRQTHKEGYDAMVKTNKFVRITSNGGLPLKLLLKHLRVPIVAEKRASILFPGYVLSMLLRCQFSYDDEHQEPLLDTEPCSLMLLGRDMDVFCDILMDGDTYMRNFGTRVAIEIVLAPDSLLVTKPYKDSLAGFFSDVTQQSLLSPFRSRLRGFKKVKVRGLVSRDLARAVEKEITQDRASDPETVLREYQGQKDEGQALFKARKTEDACLKWQDASLEIEQLQASSSWATLTTKGGLPFVSRLAEMYFLMKLNIAHVSINGMSNNQFGADMFAEDATKMAFRSLKKGYWMPDYQWKPNDVQRAKLFYRQALLYRMTDNVDMADTSVKLIETARRLLPQDAGIERELAAIQAWRASI
jgi:hypothetical protein